MKARWLGNHAARGARPLLLVLAVVLALLIAVPATALAAKVTSWTGAAGYSWSDAGNWSNGAPATGDSLVISGSAPAFSYNDIDSATLGAVGSVDASGTLTVGGGYPLIMTGPFTVSGSPLWNAGVGLGGNLTTDVAAGASPVFGGTFNFHPDLFPASALTMHVASGATARESGSMTGVGTDCSLIKTGAGDLRLGWGGSDSAAWSGANTYQGPTTVHGGTLTFWNPGALPTGSALTIDSGATVATHFGVAGHRSDTWGNTIVGSGDLDVNSGALTVDGDTNFSGTTAVAPAADLVVGDQTLTYLGGNVVLNGTLRGLGGLATLDVRSGGVVSPGVHDYEPASIWPGTNLKLRGGGSYAVDVQDIYNGNWDYLQQSDTGSSTTVYATEANPFTIKLRTCQNGVAGDMANFDYAQEYHWPVIYCPNLSGFDPNAFTVNASQFTNDFGDGKFSVAHNTDTDEIEVVYSPTEPPVITACSLPTTLAAATWTTVSPATWYVEAKDPQNNSMTLNYLIDGTGTTHNADLSTQAGHTDPVAFGQSAAEGVHSVDNWVTDVHGYPSDHVTGYFKLDSVAPSVSESTSYLTSSSTVWNNVDLTTPNGPAKLTASDATSGVASIAYRVQSGGMWGSWTTYNDSTGISISGEGAHTVEFKATDVAGNVSAVRTRYYNIDKTSPVLTFGAHSAYYGTKNVTFTWSATDNIAPVGDLRYQYKLVPPGQTESSVPYNAENTDTSVTYGTSLSPLAAGTYSFYCRVRDNAGNWDTKSFTFEVKQFTITPSAGGNGSISPASIATVDYGDSQTFTISANAHYHVADVLVDGSSVGAVSSYTFSNVTANHTINASFAIDTYTITPSAGAHGSISPATVQTVNWNGSQGFNITPATGYHVADVLVDGSSVGAVASYTFSNVAANHTISATFAINTYTITPSAGSNGSISPATAQTVNYGAGQTFTITANAHYHVADVLVDGSSVGALTSYTFSNVTANHTISVTFAIDTYTITPSAGANGSISPATVQTVNWNASQAFTITANAHYHVADVLVDGSSVGAVTSYTFSNVAANHTISASFAIDTYTITPSAGANGSISPATAQTVNWNASKTFTISANAHYHVADVLVDGSSVGAVTSYTFNNVTANHTISATFAIDTYSITPSAGTNGSISPATTQSVDWNASRTFTITANAHYHVADVLVDGSSVGAVSSYTFNNVAANHTISVAFAIDTNTITASAGTHGAISPSGATSVNYGADQSFTITPDAHYHIVDVLVDGSSVGAVSSYTFNNVAANHTISVAFAIDTNTITASAGTHGAISPSGATSVNYGADQSFTITPDAHYHIVDVLVDGVSVGAVTSRIFTNVTAGHTISATFAIDTNTITASAGTHGAISPSGATSVNYGADQSFTIQADDGYEVADVLVDGASAGAVGSYTFDNVVSSHSIDATFKLNPVVTVVAPNGGENWLIGSSHDITWTQSPGIPEGGYYQIWTYEAGSYKQIAASVPVVAGQSGYAYPWTVSSAVGTDYQIVVQYRDGTGKLLASDTSDAMFSVSIPLSLAVTSPNGGETWQKGSSHNVTWTTTTDVSTGGFQVWTYSGGSYKQIAANVPVVSGQTSYSFAWTIASTPAADFKILVQYRDGAGKLVTSDLSDMAFTILSTVVTSPNGGENWLKGSTHNVTWTATPAQSSGYFQVWTYSGGSYKQIAANVPAVSGQTSYGFAWTIASTAASDFQILVQYRDATAKLLASDLSDTVFTVSIPLVATVTSPNGGENWAKGSTHNVTWTMTPAQSSGYFQVWTYSGGSYKQIAANVPVVSGQTSYSFAWTIASTPAADVQILVQYRDGAGKLVTSDLSNATFGIVSLAVTSPNGGENWAKGSMHNVTWTATPAQSSGYFQVWTYSGGSYKQIAANVPVVSGQTSYSFAWTIASTPAADVQILVQYRDAAAKLLASDLSNAVFTISNPVVAAVSVTTPNGGENWAKGSAHDVTWTATPAQSSGYFQVWTYSGGSYKQIAANVPVVSGQTSYSFAWTIASTPAADVQILVQYRDGAGKLVTSDLSDAVFVITT